MPEQYAALIEYLRSNVKNIDDAIISVHCHDDLGLAVANSLAAVKAGARQVEGTFNGIGERAGNCALEEVVMAIKTRGDFYTGLHTGVVTREILKTSRIISRMSGLHVARSKAIVGENAFAHSSGIHQDGILKKARDLRDHPDPAGRGLGRHRIAFDQAQRPSRDDREAGPPGFQADRGGDRRCFERFKEIGDKKKFVYDDDLAALVEDSMSGDQETYSLEYIHVTSGSTTVPTATVRLKKGEDLLQDSSPGNGAVDAAMQAIDRIVRRTGHLAQYSVEAVTHGRDSLGEVTLKVDFGDGELITGQRREHGCDRGECTCLCERGQSRGNPPRPETGRGSGADLILQKGRVMAPALLFQATRRTPTERRVYNSTFRTPPM